MTNNADSSQVVSFRLYKQEVSLLQKHAKSNESLNQAAQRLLRNALTLNATEENASVDNIDPLTLSAIVDKAFKSELAPIYHELTWMRQSLHKLEFAYSQTEAAIEIQQLREQIESLKLEIAYLERSLEESSVPESSTPQPVTVLPDLFAARDLVIDNWKLRHRKESKQLLREFADQLIEQIVALDNSYTFVERLLSDLKQEQKYADASRQTILRISDEYDLVKKHLRKYESGW